MRVGRWLLEQDHRKPKERKLVRAAVARCLDVDERTLRNWKRNAREEKPSSPRGRPRTDPNTRRKALWRVGRELRHQGYPGWRPIAAVLAPEISTTLIQEYVAKFKARRRKRERDRLDRERITTTVLGRNVIWAEDGAHLGRTTENSVTAEIVKDRGPMRTVGVAVAAAPTAQTVVGLLDQLRQQRGLPLVLSTDNGALYRNEVVSAYLADHHVIHLLSLPRTPQHNGAAEIGIRELKCAAQLGRRVRLDSIHAGAESLLNAISRIDGARLHSSKGFKTAVELDETLPVIQNEIRAQFYKLCRNRMVCAAEKAPNARQARMAERESVFCTLEEFGLVKRERGSRVYAAENAEIFS